MKNKKSKVLLVTYGGGHYEIVRLICEELIKRKNLEIRLIALTNSYAKALKDFGESLVRGFKDYLFLFDEILPKVLYHGERLLNENSAPGGVVPRAESIAYLGLSYMDLVTEHGEETAQSLYSERGRQAFLPISVCKKIIEYEKPSIIVSTTSPRSEFAALQAGNQLQIPTLQILDLFGEIYPPPVAKQIVVMADFVRDQLLANGYDGKNIYPLGQPAFEKTVKAVSRLDRLECRTRIDLAEKDKVLLIASDIPTKYDENFRVSGLLSYKDAYTDLFFQVAKLYQEKGVKVLLRIHPNETEDVYQEFLKKYPFIKVINSIYNIDQSISVCDVLLTRVSSVAVQALLCGKRVVTYCSNNESIYSMPVYQSAPFLYAKGGEQLFKQLNCAFSENPGAALPEMPSESAKLIARLIEDSSQSCKD
jgi:hypothetical protein